MGEGNVKHKSLAPSLRFQNPYTSRYNFGPARDEATQRYVYAIWSDTAGLMKFGCCEGYPAHRLSGIQHASHHDAEIFGALCVGYRRHFMWERRIHIALAPWKAHGEWFLMAPEVALVAQAIRSKDMLELKAALIGIAAIRIAA